MSIILWSKGQSAVRHYYNYAISLTAQEPHPPILCDLYSIGTIKTTQTLSKKSRSDRFLVVFMQMWRRSPSPQFFQKTRVNNVGKSPPNVSFLLQDSEKLVRWHGFLKHSSCNAKWDDLSQFSNTVILFRPPDMVVHYTTIARKKCHPAELGRVQIKYKRQSKEWG